MSDIESGIGLFITGIVVIIPLLYGLYKVFLILGEYKNEKIIMPKKKDENYMYYRELPNNYNTAAGVAFLMKSPKSLTYRDYTNTLNKLIQATILELTIKDYFEIVKDNEGNSIIKILDKDPYELKESQKIILDFIIKLADGRDEIAVPELKKLYSQRKDLYRETFKSGFLYTLIDEQKELGNCTEDNIIYKKNLKDFFITFFVLIATAFLAMTGIIPILGTMKLIENGIEEPISVGLVFYSALMVIISIFVLIVNIKVTKTMMANRKLLYKDDPRQVSKVIFPNDILSFLTQKGAEERKQWVALKKYLKEYTLLEEHTTNTLEINQEYLVYATLFGIADNVQKELGNYGVINIYWDEQKPKASNNYRRW